MTTKTNTGFTIIETMLFLGVAGVLTVAILAGSGVAINQQRYRDSVNSLKSLIQQQYSQTTNVANGRSGSEACTNATVNLGATQPRGTSDCVLLGRYLTIDATGVVVTTADVVGYRTASTTIAPEAASDILEIKTNYKLGISPLVQETADVAWGARVVKVGTSQPMPLSMLILRSPLSGSIMTYTVAGVMTDLSSMVTEANSKTNHYLCVDASPGTFVGDRMAVQISPYATNQGAIQIPLEKSNVCA